MKRLLILLLAIMLLITLMSCSDDNERIKLDYLTEPPIYAFNIEEYNLFLQRCTPMPKWFITYDEVSLLGEFVSFAFEPNRYIKWNE